MVKRPKYVLCRSISLISVKVKIFHFIADIDECSLGIANCHAHSVCMNVPGWYRCDCLEGYHSHWPDNHYGEFCLGKKFLFLNLNITFLILYLSVIYGELLFYYHYFHHHNHYYRHRYREYVYSIAVYSLKNI